MKTWSFIFLATIAGCDLGERQVVYNEMSSPPHLSLDGGELVVITSNSKENSALLLFEIDPIIDVENKVILLKGFQAAGKEFKTEFKVKLKDLERSKLSDYRFYWIDPDNKRTELRLENK